jgi:hypothetical protein
MTEFKVTKMFYDAGRIAHIDKDEFIKHLKNDCHDFYTTKDLRDMSFYDTANDNYYHFGMIEGNTTVEGIQKNMEKGIVYFPFASSVDVKTIILCLENGLEVRFMSLKDFRKAKKAMTQD